MYDDDDQRHYYHTTTNDDHTTNSMRRFIAVVAVLLVKYMTRKYHLAIINHHHHHPGGKIEKPVHLVITSENLSLQRFACSCCSASTQHSYSSYYNTWARTHRHISFPPPQSSNSKKGDEKCRLKRFSWKRKNAMVRSTY